MQQHRTTKKDFPIFGNKDYKDRLYGQWLWTPSENVFITITEGQIDCLSVAQVFGLNYPVVSLPNGAPSAATIILKWMAYLCGFKYVVLCFDNDKTGHEAQQECVKLFPPGKVRYTNLVLKDPNEYLKSGRSDELKKAIYRAKEYLPDAILTGEKLLATLRNHKRKVRKWPWPTANLIISPIYCPAVYTIASWPGVGKTVTMADIIRDVIADGQKAGVISLEESIPNLLLKLSDNILGTDLRRLSNRELSEEEIESTRAITDSIVTFNHREYGSNVHEILKNLPYIAQSLNCEVIIFDNLSFSTTGLGDDERKNLDKAMLALKDSSTRYEYTLFNICHLNDDKEDFRECTMRGSRGIMMYSDQVIYLGRETESRGADRNQLMFYVKKDREFGIDTGKSFSLTYDPVLKRFVD